MSIEVRASGERRGPRSLGPRPARGAAERVRLERSRSSRAASEPDRARAGRRARRRDRRAAASPDRSDVRGAASWRRVSTLTHAAAESATALLRALSAHALSLGCRQGLRHPWTTQAAGVRERFGFEEVDRQVEQVMRARAEMPEAPLPDGVEVVTIAERPELLREAYPLAQRGLADMAARRRRSSSRSTTG